MSHDYAVQEVVRVIDGDTVQMRVDVGFYLSFEHRFRILGVDTPERGQPGFHEATAFVEAWCEKYRGSLRVETHKADSFGRWLADLYGPGGSLWQALVEAGLGEPA